MIDLFRNLAGDLTGVNPDLIAVLASLFLLFVITEFCRFLEIAIDYIFKRKK